MDAGRIPVSKDNIIAQRMANARKTVSQNPPTDKQAPVPGRKLGIH